MPSGQTTTAGRSWPPPRAVEAPWIGAFGALLAVLSACGGTGTEAPGTASKTASGAPSDSSPRTPTGESSPSAAGFPSSDATQKGANIIATMDCAMSCKLNIECAPGAPTDDPDQDKKIGFCADACEMVKKGGKLDKNTYPWAARAQCLDKTDCKDHRNCMEARELELKAALGI